MRKKTVNGLRPCSACSEMLLANPENFYLNKNGSFSSECRSCFRLRSSKNQKIRHHTGGVDYHLPYIMRGVRHRARKNKIECNIDAEFLNELLEKQGGRCAISDVTLTFEKGQGHIATNASVDRINSTKGYTSDNVQLVANQVNTMKSNLNLCELMTWCNLILDNNKN